MERYPLDMDPRSRARLDQRTAEHVERELNMARILGGAALGADRIAREPALPPREYQTAGGRPLPELGTPVGALTTSGSGRRSPACSCSATRTRCRRSS
jgi:hypothetical protein